MRKIAGRISEKIEEAHVSALPVAKSGGNLPHPGFNDRLYMPRNILGCYRSSVKIVAATGSST